MPSNIATFTQKKTHLHQTSWFNIFFKFKVLRHLKHIQNPAKIILFLQIFKINSGNIQTTKKFIILFSKFKLFCEP